MTTTRREPRLTRRQLVKVGAGLAAVGGGLGASELLRGTGTERRLSAAVSGGRTPVRTFLSRPDLKPPGLAVRGTTDSPGFVLLDAAWGQGSQAGPLIVDNAGEPVWFNPLSGGALATNLRVQTYGGEDVLTWWEGRETQYYGQGEGVIVDGSYRELSRVKAVGGRQIDLHEFVLTPEGTALFTCFPQAVKVDLSSMGGARDATVLESVIQEVDLRTGRLLLEWRSLDHISPLESYLSVSEPYDYLHLNSISVTDDGNLLVSGRGAWSIYKLDRRTGAVIWRLGGKRSDFEMGRGAQFFFQHDAVAITRTAIGVFDNGSDGTHSPGDQSRAILLDLDETRRRVRLVRSYTRPQPVLAGAMGSVQVLPNARVLVGWGNAATFSEYGAGGAPLLDARLLTRGAHSYRAFRYPWRGQPHEPPVVSSARDPHTGARTAYVSWNGATDVRHWQVLVGAAPDALSVFGVARRRGFETAISLGTVGGYVAVRALDGDGSPLATSRPVKL
jgi:hypothetical protein